VIKEEESGVRSQESGVRRKRAGGRGQEEEGTPKQQGTEKLMFLNMRLK
jgi:hypothetical protein